MDNVIITMLILASVCGISYQQNRCLFSRLDYMPCIYRNKALRRAGENQYTIHHTKLRQSASGFLECNVRAKNQIRTDITDLGTENVKILFSPGFYQEENYDNQLLVEYKVLCAAGQLAYFNVTDLEMQGEDCVDEDGNKKCQDSLIINRGNFGTTEVCGRRTLELNSSTSSVLNLQPQSFTILFRTSEEARGKGFQMYVICFKDEPLEDCFRPSDFNISECNAALSGEGSGWMPNFNTRETRHAYEDKDGLTYGDFFTGYPSGIKIRRDLAEFHNQWHRLKRQAEVQFIERNILFNESVDYIDNTIIIYDIDDNIIDTYTGIYVLQTFNTTGGITTYIGNVESDLRPHFISAGPLIIIERYAYFQLFVIDPRGILPDPEEEEQLVALTEPLLNAVPDTEDHNVTDPEQTVDPFPFFFPEEGRRKKRQVPAPNLNFTDEGVFATLRNLEACNPVVRTQAQANLGVYNRTNSTRLQKLLNFTIDCTLQSNELECEVDGPTAVLPNNSTCQINDQPPMKCDPFYEPPVIFSDMMIMNGTVITVRAINCNGQRAKQCLDNDGKRLDCY